jgi:hypothetical protein
MMHTVLMTPSREILAMPHAAALPLHLSMLRRLAAVLLLTGAALVMPATISLGEPDDIWPVRSIPGLAPTGFLIEGRYADDPGVRVVPLQRFETTAPRDVPAW